MKNIRYYVFWTLDYLIGSPIRKHYKEIKTIFNGGKEAEKLQKKLLSNIIEYAVENTEYYKKLNSKSIKNFPVIEKSDIIDNMDDMFSFEYKNKKESLRTMSTSGSSGTPFKIYQDNNKVLRNKADLIFFYELGNYYVGDRMYYLRVWNELNRKSIITSFIENMKMFDTSNIDNKGVSNFINSMTTDKSQKVILAYASSFTAIMEKLNDDLANINWKIKSIFTQSEELPLKVKRKMEAVFNCPVMSRYSNQENGIIGQQPSSGEDYFELNNGSYYIEFLKLDSDEEADEMEESRIVITDLFNKAVPMIRYDTGDLGSYTYINDNKGVKRKILSNISGRKVDYLYSNDKEKLSPHIFTNLMWEYDYFEQFQLIQENFDSLVLKLVYREEVKKDNIEEKLIEDITQLFGNKTKLKIVCLVLAP